MDQNNTGSYVRVLHGAAAAPAVDVYVDGMLALENLMFSFFTDYVLIPGGEHVIEVYETGTKEKPVLSGQWSLPLGEYFTIVVFGNLEELKLGFVRDSDGMVGKDRSDIRFIHLYPGAPAITVSTDKKVLAEGLEYEVVSPYSNLSPGMYEIMVQETDTGSPLFSFPVYALEGYPLSVYIVGSKPESEILPLIDGKNANSIYKFS